MGAPPRNQEVEHDIWPARTGAATPDESRYVSGACLPVDGAVLAAR